MAALHVIALFAFVVCWLRGGHPERFGVGVLLFDYLISSQVYRVRIGDFYVIQAVEDVVLLVLFGWLALKGNRWWPFVVTAVMALTVVVHFLTAFAPVGREAALSARLGLGILIYVTLLAGVAERWLAGEAPVSRIRRRGAPAAA